MKKDYNFYFFTWKNKLLTAIEVFGLCLGINYLFYQSVYALVILLPAAVYFVPYKRKLLIKKQKTKLLLQFKDALSSLSIALRTGYSLDNSIAETLKDLYQLYGQEEFIVREFRYMVNQMRMSIPADKLFLDFGRRSHVEDIMNFAVIVTTLSKTGGDTAAVLQKSVRMIEDKIEVKNEIDATIAGKKMEQLIMSMMPMGIVLYMHFSSPGYLDVLYGHLPGVCVMSACIVVYGFAFWMGQKIVDISI